MAMQIRILPVLAIGSLATMLPAHRVHADSAPAQLRNEIVSLSQQLMDAIGEGRKDVWRRIAADDAVIVDEFGRRQGKKDIIDSRDPRVNVYGDTSVIECEEY